MDVGTAEWSALLAQAVDLREALTRVEGPLGMAPGSPRPPAREEDLLAVEAHTGRSLPAHYRGFLSVADGWPDFHLSLDLFGTAELLAGAHAESVEDLLMGYELELEDHDLQPEDILAAGIRPDGIAVVALVQEGHAQAGRAFWWDGAESEEFLDFEDLFRYVLESQQRYLAEASA